MSAISSRDPQAASAALARAGFAPTPVSVQSNPDGTPTGTGNVTAMFTRGYIEVLFKTADTPLGREFEAALARPFRRASRRLLDRRRRRRRTSGSADAGFAMRPLVQFQRPVDTASGPGIAAFTVVRVGARRDGGGPHPDAHPSHRGHGVAEALARASQRRAGADRVCWSLSADVAEAAARFARFTGRAAKRMTFGQSIQLDRGRIEIVTETRWRRWCRRSRCRACRSSAPMRSGWRRCATAEELMDTAMLNPRRTGKALVVPFPPELGAGAWLFAENAADLPWRA